MSHRVEFRVPPEAPRVVCDSCQAAIVWIRTTNDRPMPLSLRTVRHADDGVEYAESHFVDCPDAGAWRRRR